GKAPDLDVATGRLSHRFRHADTRHLWPAIGTAWDFRHVERMYAFHACNPFGNDHALVHPFVREPWRTNQIADRVNVAHTCLAPFVDGHMRLFYRDAGL